VVPAEALFSPEEITNYYRQLERDEVTLQTNPPYYLTRHFRSVITQIEGSPIQLAAIGIGHPVGRFDSRVV
jgi:cobalamin biosynthesis protein CobT